MSNPEDEVIMIDNHEMPNSQFISEKPYTVAGIDPLEFGAGVCAGLSNLLTGSVGCDNACILIVHSNN